MEGEFAFDAWIRPSGEDRKELATLLVSMGSFESELAARVAISKCVREGGLVHVGMGWGWRRVLAFRKASIPGIAETFAGVGGFLPWPERGVGPEPQGEARCESHDLYHSEGWPCPVCDDNYLR